jgi:hypothetical protein
MFSPLRARHIRFEYLIRLELISESEVERRGKQNPTDNENAVLLGNDFG